MSANSLPTGQQRVGTNADEFNRMSFIVAQALGRLQTSTVVKIVACTNAGGLSPVGFVDVLPLVNQLDGQGNPIPHETIFNIPYARVQGGKNAIIIDPEIGDLGICLFASRDISKVKNTKAQSNPGSFRSYNFADGMYIGGLLNDTPEQYVQFSTAGIEIHSPTLVKITAPDVQIVSETVEVNASTSVSITTPQFSITGETVAIDASTSTTITTPTFTVNGVTKLNGATTVTGPTTLAGSLAQTGGGSGSNATLAGNLSVTGNITSTGGDVVAGAISLKTHKHGGVQTGGGQTGGPV